MSWRTASPGSASLIWMAVAALLIAALGYLAFDYQTGEIKRQNERNLAEIANLKASQITAWLEERRGNAAMVTRSPLVDLAEKWLREGAPEGALRQQLLVPLEAILRIYHYDTLMLLDERGSIRLSTLGKVGHQDDHLRALALEAMRTRQVVMSDMHPGEQGETAELDFVAPLLQDAGAETRAVGVVYFHVDPARFLFPLVQSWPIDSETAETLLVQQEGDKVIYLNELRHRPGTALSLSFPVGEENLPAALAAQGKTGFLSGTDYRGKRVFAYARPVQGTPWTMVAKIDEDEIYRPVQRLATYVSLIVAALLLAVVLGILLRQTQARSAARLSRAEDEKQALRHRFDLLSQFANDIILLLDEQDRIIDANDRALESYGYSRAELLAMKGEELCDQEAAGCFAQEWQLLQQQGYVTRETAHRRKDGSTFQVEQRTRLVDIGDKQLVQAVLRDISERKRYEEKLRLLERAIESSFNAIMISDAVQPGNPLIYANGAFERITGYRLEEALGRNGSFLQNEDRDQPAVHELRDAIREQREARVILRNYRKDGSLFWNELLIAPVRDGQGRVSHFIGVQNDVSERMQYEAQLEYQATHDALTGLANRTLLGDRLEQTIVFARRAGRLAAVVMLDIDRFKLVNDTLGHTCGDALIREVGIRLARCVRPGDTVARQGGDEFMVVMSDMANEDDAVALARHLLEAVAAPMKLECHDMIVTASLGVALYPKDGEEAALLMKNADVAMYRAKELGRNSFQFYSPDFNARSLERLELETRLRVALKQDELVLYYQPQVDLRSGRMIGAEALIRWQHPVLGMVSPADFIPLAEETGLIVPIGEWVIESACRQIRAWQDAGLPDMVISVNVSARQFQQENLSRVVAQSLRLNEVPARALDLEVTESAAMRNPEQTIAILRQFKEIGVKISLDDFGTGYSSLNYLKRFPIDTLKIDRSFVRDITTDPDVAAIALSVISLSHSLKLSVIAEGVETEAQLSLLRRHRCDRLQGFFFSRPVPATEFAAMVQEGRRLDGQGTDTPAATRTLLLVDDEAFILTALQRVLRGQGYRILKANSAEEGLELLALNEVQVIVSDQRMPGMSGTDFLSRVKDLYPDTIRIVLSGYTDLESITGAINRGAIFKFLSKPWEDEQLRAQIHEAFVVHEAKQDKMHRAGE